MTSTVGIAQALLHAVGLLALVACGSGGTAAEPGAGGTGGLGAGGSSGGQSANGGGGAVPVELPSCGTIAECGGDPDGEWSVRSGCLNVLRSFYTDPGCEDILAEATVDASGSYVFLEGTLTFDLDLIVHQRLSVSDACARSGTSFSNARDACTTLEASYADNATVDEAVCSVATNGRCECELTFAPQHWLDSSVYEIRNDRLYDGSGSPSEFCVDGDAMSLYLEDVSDPPAPGDTGILLELEKN